MDNEVVARLEVLTERQQKQLDDHETRIRSIEDITNIVTQINSNTEKQGKNIDKLTSTIEIMKQTQAEMNLKMQEADIRAQYSAYIKLGNALKHINFKYVIAFILGLCGFGGVSAFILSLIK